MDTIWSSQKPEHPGWYWAKCEYGIVVVEILGGDIWMIGIDQPVENDFFTHWAGPLLIPLAPE